MLSRAYTADLVLLLAALVWGGGFVAQRMGMEHMGPLTFNAVRFALGAAILVPLIALPRRRPASPQASASATDALPPPPLAVALKPGLIAGTVLFVSATLQQVGIVYTTAGKAGFITGLYVVMVPILGLAVGQHTRRTTWLGAGLAAIGLYYLSVTESLRIGPGDLLVLACAVGWAVHVLVVAHLAPRGDPVQLACVQFALTAALSALAAAAWESVRWEALTAAAGPILYGGLCSVGIGYTLQVVGQRHAPPAHAAILLSGESLFAVLGGAWFLGESLTGRETLGCVLMFGGIVVSQVRRRSRAVCRELSEPA